MMERRFATELRADTGTDGSKYIQGYAATFGHESTDDGLGFREIVMPGAFARSLREGTDVRALKNHDPNFVLGRVKNGTLQMREDSRGLFYRVQLDPNNTDHMNLHAMIARGDMDECSFGFVARSQEWSDAMDKDGNPYAQRKLHDVDLMDVSAVTYPAYGNTSVTARNARIGVMFPEGDAEIRSAIAGLVEKRGGPKPADSDNCEGNKSGVWTDDICKAWTDAYNDAFKLAIQSKHSNKVACNMAYACANKAVSEMIARSPADPTDGSDGKEDNDMPGNADNVEDDANYIVNEDSDPNDRKAMACCEKRGIHLRSGSIDISSKKMGGNVEQHGDNTDGLAQINAVLGEDGANQIVSDGNCERAECWCQNRMVDPLDVWADEDFESDDLDDDLRAKARADRKAAAEVESRAGKKARTKKVGGRNLPSSAFAYVGDPDKTETWKFPIHDKAHAQNALARFNQAKGIPASAKGKVWSKIVNAAKKFGIHVSESNASHEDSETAAMRLRATLLATEVKYGL